MASLTNDSATALLSSAQCYIAENTNNSHGRRLLQSSTYYTLYLLPPEPLLTADALTSYIASTAYTGPRSSLVLPAQEVVVRVACANSIDVAVGESCPVAATSASSSSNSISAGGIAGVVLAGIVVLLLVALIAVYLVFIRCKTATSAVSSTMPPPRNSPSPHNSSSMEPTFTKELNIYMTPPGHALTMGTGGRGGRRVVARTRAMAAAAGVVSNSLSIPTLSVAHGDDDGDSDSEHIGGWGRGNDGDVRDILGWGPVVVMDAPTEAELFSTGTATAEVSVAERTNPNVTVFIHD